MPKKPKKPATRNPMFHDVRSPKYRPRVEKSTAEKEERKDPLSRKAKHKNAPLDESAKPQTLAEFYQIGDHVEIKSGPVKRIIARAEELRKKDEDETDQKAEAEIEGIVRNFGPDDTLGITIDGEYHLIDPEDVELIYESYAADDFQDLTEWSYVTTTAGFQVPIGSEEQSILDKCTAKMYKNNLDDREQEVARLMVSKGVLHRLKDDQGIYFTGEGKKKLKRF